MILCGLLMLCGCSCETFARSKKIDKHTVSSFDLNRYMGKWYEIARFDHPFERNMVGVTAYYESAPNGKVKVVNEGYIGSKSAKLRRVEGSAKLAKGGIAGRLKVKFFFLFSSNYYVLELDELNYNYALVGSSSSKYLWILSRTPTMLRAELNKLIRCAKERGYDTRELIFVDQR